MTNRHSKHSCTRKLSPHHAVAARGSSIWLPFRRRERNFHKPGRSEALPRVRPPIWSGPSHSFQQRVQRKLCPLWRGDSISNWRTPYQLPADKRRTPSSTKLNPAPPLRTEETVYLIMDLTKPLRSELGKKNLVHVNGGRSSEWAQEVPGLRVVHTLQRLTF